MSRKLKLLHLVILSVGVLPMYMYIHICAWYLPDFLGLDLQTVVSRHVGAGN